MATASWSSLTCYRKRLTNRESLIGIQAELWRVGTSVSLECCWQPFHRNKQDEPPRTRKNVVPSLCSIPLVPSADKAWCCLSLWRRNVSRIHLQYHKAWQRRVDLELRGNILITRLLAYTDRSFFLSHINIRRSSIWSQYGFCFRKSSRIWSPFSLPLPRLRSLLWCKMVARTHTNTV